MAEVELGKIKLGGLFGASERVIFEYKYERPTENGEVKSINMYNDETGDQLAKLEYAINGTKSTLNVFNVMNWSSTMPTRTPAIGVVKGISEM